MVDGTDDRNERDARWRTRHGEQVSALDRNDPNEVKRLYKDMGRFLEDSYGTDVEGAPQLSLPETIPVVTRLLADVDGRLLDAGCGPHPVASLALADMDPTRRIVALDLGFGTVSIARARGASAGRTLLAVVADLEHLPFRGGTFGGIVCDDTIEHVPDDGLGVSELMRVTAAGGSVVLATPNRHSLSILLQRGRDRARGARRPASDYFVAESHLREYTWPELAQLVRPHAVVADRATVGWHGRRTSRLASRLTALPGLRHVDRMLVARLTPR